MRRIVSGLICVMCIAVLGNPGFAQDLKLPDCPTAVTSFGAAVCGDYLYLYGGNEGTSHSYSLEGQNNVFRRIRLEAGSKWESLGEVPRRQGNALVSYQGKIYQVGGFAAKNTADEDQHIESTDEFACYDPGSKTWLALESLPEPRSSFDAAVLGDTLFVIGGWSLNGPDNDSTWHENAWRIDLSDANAKWVAIKNPPFVRRANSVGVFKNRIYVLGGMAQRGGPTNKVAIYDPENDAWSEGPAIPGDNMQGFGNSCFNVGGELVVSTANGQILKLNANGSEWEKIHQMESGRFFHRLVAIDSHRFVVLGGTGGKTGKQPSVVVYDMNALHAGQTPEQTQTKNRKTSDDGN